MDKRPLIIDCDPGVDEALALMLLNSCGVFDIKGITVVDGCTSLRNAAVNAIFLSELFGISADVAIGARRPMLRQGVPYATKTNGKNGLADYPFKRSGREIYSGLAWELIYKTAREMNGALELITLGPLTNIATAVLKYPSLPEMIKRIVVCAGATRQGNITSYAEYNAYRDPHALSVILEAGFKELTFIDLEAGKKAFMNSQEADKMLDVAGDVGRLLYAIRSFEAKRQAGDKIAADSSVFVSQATAAAAVSAFPEIARAESYYVICETQSPLTSGHTIVDWHDRLNHHPNASVVLDINRDAYTKLFYDCVSLYSDRSGGKSDE